MKNPLYTTKISLRRKITTVLFSIEISLKRNSYYLEKETLYRIKKNKNPLYKPKIQIVDFINEMLYCEHFKTVPAFLYKTEIHDFKMTISSAWKDYLIFQSF